MKKVDKIREELKKMSDEDLISQFQRGTEEAFNILVERHSERLKKYVYNFIKNIDTSDDIVQDTWMRVHRNRHGYRRIAKFSTWVYTIAGNLARSEFRKWKRHERRVSSLTRTNMEGDEYESHLEVSITLPDREADEKGKIEALYRALHEIPDSFREVVVLRDFQNLSYEEITEITGLPLGTVKSRINRGRTKLQDLLRDISPEMYQVAQKKRRSKYGRRPLKV